MGQGAASHLLYYARAVQLSGYRRTTSISRYVHVRQTRGINTKPGPLPQIAVMCWANVGIMLAVFLAQRHFAHQTNISYGCVEIGPTSL